MIAVIEDDADLAYYSQLILRAAGRAPVVFSNSQEMVGIDWSLIDAVMCDWMLVGSDEDGAQLAARIRQEHPDIPVLVYSASPEEARQAVRATGSDVPVVGKPFQWEHCLGAWSTTHPDIVRSWR